MTVEHKIRQPIVTVCGHVDHGKTSILDCFRGSSMQKGEAGGITQKISFTRYPREQIVKVCPMLEEKGVKLEIPGFLFIDTPGHAAFTNLRKRGGSLADLAIVVVSVKEGIQPQTAEVLQILKAHKTPFFIALNKIDSLSGWTNRGSVEKSVKGQGVHTSEEFQESLLTFQGSLKEHGFDSALFYEIGDFTKEIAIVPCSARTKEGISELLFVLSGLCQRFLKERLKVGGEGKGVVLEIKKEKTMERVEAILYDGTLSEGEEIVVASFDGVVVSKVRALEEALPLTGKYHSVRHAHAASGVRLQLNVREGILPGMPFQVLKGNLEDIKSHFKKDLAGVVQIDGKGIIVKADSLGSLEALMVLLKQAGIRVLKAGIGSIGKGDLISGKAILENEPLDAVILGFNVEQEEGLDFGNVTVFSHSVVYKLIEDVLKWREERAKELEKERMMGLATICKLEILPQFVFRNSNPAIFGVRVVAGKVRVGLPLIDERGEELGRVKSLQHEKNSVVEGKAGQELALAVSGIQFDRRLAGMKQLYVYLSDKQLKALQKESDLLTGNERRVIEEIAALVSQKK